MEFFNQTYTALRGPTGAPQGISETIGRLSDRLSPDTLLADRRAAVLSLKGLSRDCKKEVGDRALPGLLEVLFNDAEVDVDIGKAVIETIRLLCDVEDGHKELGFGNTDYVLSTETATHKLFFLLGDTDYHIRFTTLQLLSALLQTRRQVVQGYFLTAPAGPGSIMSVLEDKREITRNEGMSVVQSLISQSPDIQKVLAFEGAFEKLFNVVAQEGGVEGGTVAQDALICVDGLLRFNTSNQSYFRETALPPTLCNLLLFPPSLRLHDVAPQEFALQFWDTQKLANATVIVDIMGMLVGAKGTSSSPESAAYMRCLVETALASNAPTLLKTQALRLLPTNLTFPLSQITLTPYMPVPDTNGEEWDRLEPASALDALVELSLHGEYNGLDSEKRLTQALELRAVASVVFENYIRKDDIGQAILHGMLPSEEFPDPPVTPLLHAVTQPPTVPLNFSLLISTHFAALLFAHILRSSSQNKALARRIKAPLESATAAGEGDFFVPADGGAPPPPPEESDDEDEPQTLLQTLCENLTLGFLSRSRADNSQREAREWDRVVVGYLCLLAQWLWDDPASVREFLDAGGLTVLVEPINHTAEAEPVVPGLCAFLLGTCYEFNRDPGEVTRSTIHLILNRLGVDAVIGRMSRLREDDRSKAIGPDTVVLPYPKSAHRLPGAKPEIEGEIWFDWAFVDFWKSNYYTIQRGFATDPNALSSSANAGAESAMLVASLRDVIRQQAQEIQNLQAHFQAASSTKSQEIDLLKSRVKTLSEQVESSEEKHKEVEKEQEDLLVLLDEVSVKRKRDKERMRAANLDVSEDEADDDEDDDEEDDE